MKEYLKMNGVFNCVIVPDARDDVICLCDGPEGSFQLAEFYNEDECIYAAHAINSHDELVAEVERLRGLIDRIISSAQELEKKMPSTEFGDGYKQCAMDTASAIESCINKGA